MINTDKFCWKENEFKIVKTQCELCEFRNKDNEKKCAKYEQKPREILLNEIRCSYFSRKGAIKL